MLAEVAERDAGREAGLGQGARGRRHEHLAAVPRGGDAGSPVDVEADVVAVGRHDAFARVEAHPDAERDVGRPWLRGQ